MNRFVAMIASSTLLVSLSGPASLAQEGRYVMQRADDGFVRLDTQTGEMSLCRKQDEQFVCRMSADDRRALEAEIGLLEERIARLEAEGSDRRDGLTTEDEIDRTMGIMENMMRRFMGVIEEFESELRDETPDKAQPEKT
ncbi:MAG: hypothetical protein NXI27_17485 [Alphaproteobacteria bacterium]|nr:hypothetical protein [Alphaproteobacteria bacterium]